MSGSLPGCPCSCFPDRREGAVRRRALRPVSLPQSGYGAVVRQPAAVKTTATLTVSPCCRSQKQSSRHRCQRQAHRDLRPPSAAAAGDLSAADLPPESGVSEEFDVQVFPRRRERDPYRRLGVPREASFEEVQDARDFLYRQYRGHEHSRESIELAYDRILQEKMNVRHKHGFKPVRTGRKTDLQGDPETCAVQRLSFFQRLKERVEPDVPGTTLVNDGSIFAALALWSAWQSAAAEPTLPLGIAICFCAWKLFDKRTKRNPEGPYFGNSPVWGALGLTIFGLCFGGLVSWLAVSFLPLPKVFTPLGLGTFLVSLALGATAIFLK